MYLPSLSIPARLELATGQGGKVQSKEDEDGAGQQQSLPSKRWVEHPNGDGHDVEVELWAIRCRAFHVRRSLKLEDFPELSPQLKCSGGACRVKLSSCSVDQHPSGPSVPWF